jgi:hypothetical protein
MVGPDAVPNRNHACAFEAIPIDSGQLKALCLGRHAVHEADCLKNPTASISQNVEVVCLRNQRSRSGYRGIVNITGFYCFSISPFIAMISG